MDRERLVLAPGLPSLAIPLGSVTRATEYPFIPAPLAIAEPGTG